MMEIFIAKGAGFCFGVKKAVDKAFETAETTSGKVGTFGPIIHNPQVVERLSKVGVKPVDDIDEEVDTLIIRTHGVPVGTEEELRKRNINIIDATCPFVKKAQRCAKLLKDEGYQVVILGDKNHPEVKGLISYAGEDAVVVKDADELPELKERVGLVVQTTQPNRKLNKLFRKVLMTAAEVKVYNTICSSTELRQSETAQLAKKVELMIVVGGKNSANTKHLTNLCNKLNVKTYHIENADELEKEWFAGIKKVGITAGASTPEWIIDDIVRKIESIDRGGQSADGA
jgi:4-hydroxy-3-methylbut-2-enyl diphosphate reductase